MSGTHTIDHAPGLLGEATGIVAERSRKIGSKALNVVAAVGNAWVDLEARAVARSLDRTALQVPTDRVIQDPKFARLVDARRRSS